METKLEHFKSGVIQELPLQIGVFPFGLIYGILAIESGLSVLQAVSYTHLRAHETR